MSNYNDSLYCRNNDHEWEDKVSVSRMAGTVHVKCKHCLAVSLDIEDHVPGIHSANSDDYDF